MCMIKLDFNRIHFVVVNLTLLVSLIYMLCVAFTFRLNYSHILGSSMRLTGNSAVKRLCLETLNNEK